MTSREREREGGREDLFLKGTSEGKVSIDLGEISEGSSGGVARRGLKGGGVGSSRVILGVCNRRWRWIGSGVLFMVGRGGGSGGRGWLDSIGAKFGGVSGGFVLHERRLREMGDFDLKIGCKQEKEKELGIRGIERRRIEDFTEISSREESPNTTKIIFVFTPNFPFPFNINI